MPAVRGRDVVASKPSVLGDGLHPLEQVQPLDAVAPLVREPEEVRLARKLLEWEEWPGRWHEDREGEYKWGFISAASQHLFKRGADGGYFGKTHEAIACAERLEAKEGGDASSTS